MEGLLALDWPSWATWSAAGFGAALALVANTHRHVRRAFHQWRLDRRTARDPYILREELNEYEWALGEDLEPLSPEGLAILAILGGVVTGLPVWVSEIDLELWWLWGSMALVALGGLLGIWRWLNDPESDPEALEVWGERISFVSISGAAGAIGIVGLFVYLIS